MAIENIKKDTFIVTLHDERHTPINPKEVPKLAIKANMEKINDEINLNSRRKEKKLYNLLNKIF